MKTNHVFLKAETWKVLLEVKGWSLSIPKEMNGLAIFSPDFYPDDYVIASSKKSKIMSVGETSILYRGVNFDSVQSLMDTYGQDAISEFDLWEFTVQKEWVVFRNGEFITTFSDYLDIPKRTKIRC